MSQEYTPVVWVDETENQVGTVINKARLDQMQSAHHYADGFEEVDAVPTADPHVDYHKVVFCTADTTFYRWDGTQWVKDVDDSTLALLQAHEADHNNPHVVTKTQVGLGNVDNKGTVSSWQSTPDNDHIPTEKLVKDGLDAKVDDSQIVSAFQGTPDNTHIASEKLTKDSLDAKLDDSQLVTSWSGTVSDTNIPSEKLTKDSLDLKINTSAIVSAWQVTPDDSHIPSEKLVKTYIDTSLTDGSVTKIGTATVGGDLKPVYLNAGVPTAVANDFVDVSTNNQSISGSKIFTNGLTVQASSYPNIYVKDTDSHIGDNISAEMGAVVGRDGDDKRLGEVRFIKNYNSTDGEISIAQLNTYKPNNLSSAERLQLRNSNNSGAWAQAPYRTYNPSNTSDIVTIGSLQASSDVVHTVNAETVNGLKTFTGDLTTMLSCASGIRIQIKHNEMDGTIPSADQSCYIMFSGKNDNYVRGSVGYGVNTTGDGYMYLSARRYNNAGTKTFRFVSANNGDGYATTPIRITSSAQVSGNTTYDDDIVTIGTLKKLGLIS